MRKWAAPQHNSNKFGSAFGLLHYCNANAKMSITLVTQTSAKVQIFYDITPIYICIFLNRLIVVVTTAEVLR